MRTGEDMFLICAHLIFRNYSVKHEISYSSLHEQLELLIISPFTLPLHAE